MNFSKLMNEVKKKYHRLIKAEPFVLGSFPKNLPGSGIYYMEEKGHALYVGRSNNIRRRLKNHTRPRHNAASFAFLLTRKATGNLKAAYSVKGSRSALLNNPKFKKIFHLSIARIRKMRVRVIEEDDQIRQALLEIYTACKLKTPFNDFGTH